MVAVMVYGLGAVGYLVGPPRDREASSEFTATNSLGQDTATTQVQVFEITSRVFIPMLVKP